MCALHTRHGVLSFFAVYVQHAWGLTGMFARAASERDRLSGLPWMVSSINEGNVTSNAR